MCMWCAVHMCVTLSWTASHTVTGPVIMCGGGGDKQYTRIHPSLAALFMSLMGFVAPSSQAMAPLLSQVTEHRNNGLILPDACNNRSVCNSYLINNKEVT